MILWSHPYLLYFVSYCLCALWGFIMKPCQQEWSNFSLAESVLPQLSLLHHHFGLLPTVSLLLLSSPYTQSWGLSALAFASGHCHNSTLSQRLPGHSFRAALGRVIPTDSHSASCVGWEHMTDISAGNSSDSSKWHISSPLHTLCWYENGPFFP